MISLQVNLDMSVALARMVTPEDLQAGTPGTICATC